MTSRKRLLTVSRLLLAPLILFFNGCTVGPRYETPEMALATEFTEEESLPGSEISLNEWWMQFNDPILNEMIDEAIAHNYDLQIATERIGAVRAHYQLASANLFPEIDLNGTVQRSRLSQSVFLSPFEGPSVQNLFQLGFDASWEIDFFGRLRSLKEAALFDLEASWENRRGIYITLLSEVARHYTDFRSFQEQIELNQDQIEILQQLLNLSEVRYRAGLRSEIEPLQTETELNDLQASIPILEAKRQQSLYRIAVLLGKTPEEIPEKWIAFHPLLEAKGKIPVGLPSDLLQRRPDIREAERKLAAATAQVRASIASFFPTFSLTGGIGLTSDQAGHFFRSKSETWNIGPSIFWPAIDFGRVRSQVDQNEAIQREMLLTYEQTVLQALEEVEDSLVAYYKEEERQNLLLQKVLTLRQIRDLASVRYEAGLSSLSNLLQADQEWLKGALTLIESKQTLSENLIAVYKSLGGDWTCSPTP